MGLVLDEPKDDDIIYSKDNVILLADARMRQEITQEGGLKIEYVNDPWRGTGLMIAFAKPSADCSSGGCSSCS